MIKYWFNLSPNPSKVALFLEESGLPYEPIPVDTRRGQQFDAAFTALNPNAKVPVIQDGEAIVFDSNAILLYLGEKTGQFMPAAGDKARGEMLSWLMFVASGIGPYNGQAVHFRHFAPQPIDYARNRYHYEAERHFGICDQRLATRRYMLGDSYTIVDMALWGWARLLPFVLGSEQAWEKLPHLKRWFDEVHARPAAQRALALKDKFVFKAEMDEEARRNMFKHLALTPAA